MFGYRREEYISHDEAESRSPDMCVYRFDFHTHVWSTLVAQGNPPNDPEKVYALASWREYMFALSFSSEVGIAIEENFAADHIMRCLMPRAHLYDLDD